MAPQIVRERENRRGRRVREFALDDGRVRVELSTEVLNVNRGGLWLPRPAAMSKQGAAWRVQDDEFGIVVTPARIQFTGFGAFGWFPEEMYISETLVASRKKGLLPTVNGMQSVWTDLFPSVDFIVEWLGDHISHRFRFNENPLSKHMLYGDVSLIMGVTGNADLSDIHAPFELTKVGGDVKKTIPMPYFLDRARAYPFEVDPTVGVAGTWTGDSSHGWGGTSGKAKTEFVTSNSFNLSAYGEGTITNAVWSGSAIAAGNGSHSVAAWIGGVREFYYYTAGVTNLPWSATADVTSQAQASAGGSLSITHRGHTNPGSPTINDFYYYISPTASLTFDYTEAPVGGIVIPMSLFNQGAI